MELQTEACGVTRKDVPLEIFRSIYLCDFSAEDGPKFAVKSVKEIGIGNWKEGVFWDRLRKVLSGEVRCPGCALIHLSVLC